jgi:hypothetical protein
MSSEDDCIELLQGNPRPHRPAGAGNGAFLLPAVAVLMTAVGLLASVGAAKRGLRVQPTEALREQERKVGIAMRAGWLSSESQGG